MKETLSLCSSCGEALSETELHQVGDQLFCEDCYDENTLTCERCGEIILSENNAGSGSYPLCRSCFDENYTYCCRCDSLLRLDEAYYIGADDDGPYCSYCYSEEERERAESEIYIHDYSYKPEYLFYGTGSRFYGLELEIDGAGKSESAAKAIIETANTTDDLIFVKSDGSLNDGLEIVSMPATLSYHLHELPWEQILKKAMNLHYRSHATDTCGLHIHVNRDSFGEDIEEQDLAIAKILYFFESHWPELLIFSRRQERQLSKWAARCGYKEDTRELLNHAKKLENGRYSAINLCNFGTIEVRICRGTLRLNTFRATIELVDEICHLADVIDDESLKRLSWSEFVAGIDVNAKPELVKYLKEKRIYINSPIDINEEDV
jgi:hypothetical protein